MNITPAAMYWITRCDNIFIVSIIVAIMSSILFVILASVVALEDPTEEALRGLRVSSAIVIVSVLAAVFVPTTKDMAAIYVIPKIANSQTVKELGDGVVTLAREWLEELRPAKEGGAK